MASIDWSVVSGPYISRRTLMKLAGATGAAAYAIAWSPLFRGQGALYRPPDTTNGIEIGGAQMAPVP